MKMIIREENDCGHNVEGDAVKCLEDCVCRDEVLN